MIELLRTKLAEATNERPFVKAELLLGLHGEPPQRYQCVMQTIWDSPDDQHYAEVAGKLVIVKMKAGEGGKAFGSVSAKEIAEAFQAQHNLEIDKKKIQLQDALKSFGAYEVPVKLHPQVTGKLNVRVTEA